MFTYYATMITCTKKIIDFNMTHKKYICTTQDGDSGYSSVKRSSRYVTHSLYECAALHTGSTSCALWDMDMM